jgi:D-alanyl-lipoteichoic acid acyltransferase DltB (MBOAT superfamily)
MYWDPRLVVLLLLTTLVSYFSALGIERYPQHKKALLILTLMVCLGVLVYFKYANFFLEIFYTISNGFIGSSSWLTLEILLPIGISFYTFQTLSYVIDVYRGDFIAERHLGYYALFVVYFPQLVAGPIENPGDLLPQLRRVHKLNTDDLAAGGRLLLCGFFRKCAVADVLGIYVNRAFADIGSCNALGIFITGVLFYLQMYCDFAGYSEIAAGCARLMGIRLMRNFNRPLISQSYTEFFRRWHISLNRWFTNYLYIPLGGNRKGKVRKVLNTILVFALCGLWHGPRWTYVFWGLYAAFFVSLESLLKKPMRPLVNRMSIDRKSPFIKLVRRSYMLLIFIPASLMFRAVSVGQLSKIFPILFTDWGIGGDYITTAFMALGIDAMGLLQIGLSIVCMARLYDWGNYDLPPAKTQHASAKRLVSGVYLLLVIALSWISLLATQEAAGFAYFQF